MEESMSETQEWEGKDKKKNQKTNGAKMKCCQSVFLYKEL